MRVSGGHAHCRRWSSQGARFIRLLGALAVALALPAAANSDDGPTSGLHDLVAAPGGAAWFSADVGPTLGQVTPTGALTEFPLRSVGINVGRGTTYQLAASPDGTVWMQTAGGVVRRSGDGRWSVIRLGATPSFGGGWLDGGEDMGSMAVGPDGALWGTGFGSEILQLQPSGELSRFPTPYRSMAHMTAGPDGRMWFVARLSDERRRVAAASMRGEVADVSGDLPAGAPPQSSTTPDRGQGPEGPSLGGMTIGPDGSAWLTERSRNVLYRVTPQGSVTEVPVSARRLGGITSDRISSLWFADPDGGSLTRMTPAGLQTRFSLPRAADRAAVIAAVGDGSVWFLDPGANRIGRVGADGRVALFGRGLSVYPWLGRPTARFSRAGVITVRVRTCASRGRIVFRALQLAYPIADNSSVRVPERSQRFPRIQRSSCQVHQLRWKPPSAVLRPRTTYVLNLTVSDRNGEKSSAEQVRRRR